MSACHEIILTHSSLRVYFIHGKERNTLNLGKKYLEYNIDQESLI